MKTLTAEVERISFEQATELKNIGVNTPLSSISSAYQYSLAGLKKIGPYTITTGVHEGRSFATTRRMPCFPKEKDNNPELQKEFEEKMWASHIKEHYVFADSEIEAAYNLVVKHIKNKVFSIGDCRMKMAEWKPDTLVELSLTY